MTDIKEYNGKKFYTEKQLSSLIDVDFYSFKMKMVQYTYYKGVIDDHSIQPSTIVEAKAQLKILTDSALELPKDPTIKDILDTFQDPSSMLNEFIEENTTPNKEKLGEETPWLDIIIQSLHSEAPVTQKYIEGIFKLCPLRDENLASFYCGTIDGLTDTLKYTEYCSRPELSGEFLSLGVEHVIDFHPTFPCLYDWDIFKSMCNEIGIPLKHEHNNEPNQELEVVSQRLKETIKERDNLTVELENTKLSNKISPQGRIPLLRTINSLATALINRPISDKPNNDAKEIETIFRDKQREFNDNGINFQFSDINRKTLKSHLALPD